MRIEDIMTKNVISVKDIFLASILTAFLLLYTLFAIELNLL